MGLFRRKRKGEPTRHYVVEATATRALTPQVRGMMATILCTFELENGERVEVELQFDEASKFLEQMLAAHHAIVGLPIRPISPFIG